MGTDDMWIVILVAAGRKKPRVPTSMRSITKMDRAEMRQKKYRYLYQVRTAHGDIISQVPCINKMLIHSYIKYFCRTLFNKCKEKTIQNKEASAVPSNRMPHTLQCCQTINWWYWPKARMTFHPRNWQKPTKENETKIKHAKSHCI